MTTHPRRASPASGALRADGTAAGLCAEILKAVAHPLRLRIVAILCGGEQHVNALSELLGARQSIVSQQLRILRMHDLVRVTRRDGFAMYSLAEPHLADLVGCMERCVSRRGAAPGTARRAGR